MGVDRPEQGKNADHAEPCPCRLRSKLPAGDHLDSGLAPFEPAAERPLDPVQNVGPVEGKDEPSGTGPGEFPEGGPPLLRKMEMMEEAQGEDEREGSVAKRQAPGDIGYYPYRIMGNWVLGAGPPDHGHRQVAAHRTISGLDQKSGEAAVAAGRVQDERPKPGRRPGSGEAQRFLQDPDFPAMDDPLVDAPVPPALIIGNLMLLEWDLSS